MSRQAPPAIPRPLRRPRSSAPGSPRATAQATSRRDGATRPVLQRRQGGELERVGQVEPAELERRHLSNDEVAALDGLPEDRCWCSVVPRACLSGAGRRQGEYTPHILNRFRRVRPAARPQPSIIRAGRRPLFTASSLTRTFLVNSPFPQPEPLIEPSCIPSYSPSRDDVPVENTTRRRTRRNQRAGRWVPGDVIPRDDHNLRIAAVHPPTTGGAKGAIIVEQDKPRPILVTMA